MFKCILWGKSKHCKSIFWHSSLQMSSQDGKTEEDEGPPVGTADHEDSRKGKHLLEFIY